MYITDEKGKWKVEGNVKMLTDPSESYLSEKELERQKQEEKELLNSLVPTQEEVQKAETELLVIELLQELEVI